MTRRLDVAGVFSITECHLRPFRCFQGKHNTRGALVSMVASLLTHPAVPTGARWHDASEMEAPRRLLTALSAPVHGGALCSRGQPRQQISRELVFRLGLVLPRETKVGARFKQESPQRPQRPQRPCICIAGAKLRADCDSLGHHIA